MAEQVTNQLTASGDFATEKKGSRLFITEITVSGNAVPTSVQVRQGDGAGTIIWELNDAFGHHSFVGLEGADYNGSGGGDLYITIAGGTTPIVSVVGYRGKPQR